MSEGIISGMHLEANPFQLCEFLHHRVTIVSSHTTALSASVLCPDKSSWNICQKGTTWESYQRTLFIINASNLYVQFAFKKFVNFRLHYKLWHGRNSLNDFHRALTSSSFDTNIEQRIYIDVQFLPAMVSPQKTWGKRTRQGDENG